MSDKAIFLDRDDTLIEDPGYINNPSQVKLLDGVPEALVELRALGYKLIVVTNQSAVARGIVTEKVLGEIHDRLRQLLAEKNAFLDGIYYCPFHPEGVVPKYRKESDWRKPNPGMLRKAAEEMDLDLSQSWCVGSGSRDVQAGRRAGCKTILIDKPSHQKPLASVLSAGAVVPDYRAVNIKEAVNIIKKYLRSFARPQAQAVPAAQAVVASQADEEAAEVAELPSQIEQAEPEIQEPEVQEPQVQLAEPEPELEPPAAEPEIPPAEEAKPQRAEPQARPRQAEPKTRRIEFEAQPTEQQAPDETPRELLNSILAQLKTMQREEMFGEFSVMRLVAGVVQIIVFFCLLVTVWLLMSPERQASSVSIALGFAIVFQLMALTFYVMHGRK